MIRVYIAGPIHGSGTEIDNVRMALHWAELVWAEGMRPFVPHLFSFWNFVFPKKGEKWLELDFEWLHQCHALLRLPGVSPGSDAEVKEMSRLGRPVFNTQYFDGLCTWAKEEERRLRDLGLWHPIAGGPLAKPEVKFPDRPRVPGPYEKTSYPTHVGGQMLPSVCIRDDFYKETD